MLVHPAAPWLKQAFAAGMVTSPRLLMALMALCWVLWSMAMAEPQWVNGEISVSRYGRDIMLLVDLSGSMVINDYSGPGGDISRLRAVKQVLSPFIEERATDRIGLVLFGEQAYVQTPLTYDHTLVRKLLDRAKIGLVGDRTAIGDGIALAVKHLQHAAEVRRAGGGQAPGAGGPRGDRRARHDDLWRKPPARGPARGVGARDFGHPRQMNRVHSVET